MRMRRADAEAAAAWTEGTAVARLHLRVACQQPLQRVRSLSPFVLAPVQTATWRPTGLDWTGPN